MEPLLDGTDFETITDALSETSGLTDRLLQVKRNSGFTGGTLDGTDPSPTYFYFNLMGTIESVTKDEAVHSGGMLELGDISLTTTFDILEKGEGGDGYTLQESDVLIYDQKEYYTVGRPYREYVAGGIAFTRSYWRRT